MLTKVFSNKRTSHSKAARPLARTYLDMNDYPNAKKYAEFAAESIQWLQSDVKRRMAVRFKDHNSEWFGITHFTPTTCNIYASILVLLSCRDTSDMRGAKVDIDIERLIK